MRFVRVPELTAEPTWQRYEPLGNRVVRYLSSVWVPITLSRSLTWSLLQDPVG